MRGIPQKVKHHQSTSKVRMEALQNLAVSGSKLSAPALQQQCVLSVPGQTACFGSKRNDSHFYGSLELLYSSAMPALHRANLPCAAVPQIVGHLHNDLQVTGWQANSEHSNLMCSSKNVNAFDDHAGACSGSAATAPFSPSCKEPPAPPHETTSACTLRALHCQCHL